MHEARACIACAMACASGVLRRSIACGALAVATLLSVAPTAEAGTIVLSDTGLNSSVTVDTNSQAGVSNWTVDGVNHLSQQWFWYRIGNAGGESSIDTLLHNDATDEFAQDTNFTPGDDTLVSRYFDSLNRFEVELRVSLQAGSVGSNSSALSQQVAIKNTSGAVLPLRFYMYSDFKLDGTILSDTVNITGGNTATQADSTSGIVTSQVVVTPIPTRVQASDRDELLMLLNNMTPTTLDNSTSYSGSGDAAWALQWNVNIPDGASFIFSNSQSIQETQVVPEPASLALALVGGASLFVFARRYRRQCGQ